MEYFFLIKICKTLIQSPFWDMLMIQIFQAKVSDLPYRIDLWWEGGGERRESIA